jgi:hypothetical protein
MHLTLHVMTAVLPLALRLALRRCVRQRGPVPRCSAAQVLATPLPLRLLLAAVLDNCGWFQRHCLLGLLGLLLRPAEPLLVPMLVVGTAAQQQNALPLLLGQLSQAVLRLLAWLLAVNHQFPAVDAMLRSTRRWQRLLPMGSSALPPARRRAWLRRPVQPRQGPLASPPPDLFQQEPAYE